MPKIDRDDLATKVGALIDRCESATESMSGKRQLAMDYYVGKMPDLPSEEGRSTHVSRDVRAVIKKVLPAIKRVILGSDDVVEYQPVAQGDEGGAKQASLYVNRVVLPECRGDEAISDAIVSALLLEEGVLKWWHEEKSRVTVTHHSGLLPEEFEQLAQDSGAEVLEAEEYPVEIEGQTFLMARGRVRRVVTERSVRLASVPLEDFGINPEARSIDEAAIVYHRNRVTRSDLVARGYDRELVESLGEAETRDHERAEGDDEVPTITGNYGDDGADPSMEEVDVYEAFVRIDADGDGIAELREVHYVPGGSSADGTSAGQILFDDYADEARLAIVVAERVMHSHRGVSLFDDAADIQLLKTVLTRQTLDNLYWQNNPQPVVEAGTVKNLDALMSPSFGEPIYLREGTPAGAGIHWNVVPYIADKSLAMIERASADLAERTGITPAASGLDPNALQDVREQAVNMISDSASAQAWCMVREMAQGGIRRAFRGILKLIVQHQDKPRVIRMQDKWVEIDPRSWNAEMDCEVNTGLGTGTRERDLSAMMMVANYQEKIIQAFGPDNPFVTPKHIYNTVSRITEVAGLRTSSLYFAEPPEGTRLGPQGPSPEEMKLQGQMALEKMKMEANRDKESAQAEADVIVRQKDAEREDRKAMIEAHDREQERMMKVQLEREKLAAMMQIEREKMIVSERAARMNAGEDVANIDPETGDRIPTVQDNLAVLVAGLSEQMRAMQAAFVAPRTTEILRDEAGRAVGAVQRVEEGR